MSDERRSEEPPRDARPAPVASWRHTIIVLLILAAVTITSAASAARAGDAHTANLPLTYLVIAAGEWAIVFYIHRGVRARGGRLVDLVGRRRPGARGWLLDGLWAGLFFLGASLVLGGVSWLVGRGPDEAHVARFLPHGALEIALFVLLALTAGICEELMYRGYLQRQLGALTGSMAGGVVLQAVVFGLSHGYQGARSMIVITVYGLLFGLLAWRLKSLRPGMIAHAWQDIWSGVLARGV